MAIKTKLLDSLCQTVSAQIRKRGIRQFSRDTEVPVATAGKWANRKRLEEWNALDLLAALVHTGGRLDLTPGPGRSKTETKRNHRLRTRTTKTKRPSTGTGNLTNHPTGADTPPVA